MELAELGKKTMQIIAPNSVLTVVLVGLNRYFDMNIMLSTIIIYNILLIGGYLIIWHEFRLQDLERKIEQKA